MRLGFSIGTLGPVAAGPDEQLRLAREAERLGYESLWASEGYGADPATTLAWLAAGTGRIELGSGIIQISGRTAVATAMAAATIDRLSGGRFRLGLGVSGPQVTEGGTGAATSGPWPTCATTCGSSVPRWPGSPCATPGPPWSCPCRTAAARR
nr:hypothetical protein GCM10020093_013520 [Planobispora longispora]